MSRPSDQARALRHDGRPRRYLVHRPVGRDDRDPLPAVVVLHGTGATAAWTLGDTCWADKSDREGFLVVLPDGLRPDLAKPPHFLDNPQVWNDGSPKLVPNEPEGDDVGFVDAMLDALIAEGAVDPRRVCVTGFSNGAGMAFRLAAERSGRFAAVAAVAGHCWLTHPRPERPTPTLILAGGADPLCPVEGGEIVTPWEGRRIRRPPLEQTLRRWAAALACPPEPPVGRDNCGVHTRAYSGCAAELTVHVIQGLGHHWPGGRGQFNPRLAGPPCDRLIANDVIWDFFKRYSL
ncbi:MAG TPA: PHB depolymerase family esterase [Gemmataceae bacterium]|nr:PHB depolymerase family esterase [Gemmataceae bacterium]